ncbi:ABC transporter permease [Trueperella bialowiezensis]|uniref:Macrolide export ATP-binding/permease protein MacB n=1 Tax=Trueperella bialowiezensis TaxID=312285 RepID=A0A3S4UY61_9ACTO|nr:FtsX-like permease family protein [Trueperella bialowiezensis]VEI12769.1 Macrolide export ATP-binding/permease protein MacB [Trueperella bialowiezensis]
MWKVTLRDAKEHFGRFLMSVIAVTIGVAFLCGTLSLRDLLSASFSDLTSSTYRDDIYVSGPQIATDPIPLNDDMTPADLETIAGVEGVRVAYPVRQTMAYVYDDDGQQANMYGAPGLGYSYQSDTDDPLLVEGRAPASGEIVIERSAATRAGIEVGDEVHVVIGEPSPANVVGIVEYGTPMAGASVILMDEADLIARIGEEFSEVAVKIEDGQTRQAVKERIAAQLPADYVVHTVEETRAETDDAVSEILDMVNTFLLVFVIIAITISTFIITNTFTISVRQRQRQFALLRAIGASPRQVFQAVMLQALLIGLIGSIIGVVVGQGLLFLIKGGLEAAGMPLGGSVLVTGKTAIISIIAGTVVTFLATIVPSRRAALTPAIEAMREGSGQKEKPLARRTIISVVLLVAGTVAMVVGAVNGASPLFGPGVAAMFIGVIDVMPALVHPVAGTAGWAAKKIAPATGVLASRSLSASPRKTATTSVALAIGVALVCAGSSVAASLDETITQNVDTEISADIVMLSPVEVHNAPEIAKEVEKIAGVAAVDATMTNGWAVANPVTAAEPNTMTAMTGASSARAIDSLGMRFLEGTPGVLDSGQAAIFDNVAESIGVGVGDDVALTSPAGTIVVPVGAIIETGTLTFGQPQILLPPQLAEELQPAQSYTPLVAVFTDDGADIAAIKDEIKDLVKDQYVWLVNDRADIKNIAGGQVTMLLTMLYALLALSVVIAVIGVVNTLTLSVVDRTREIGLLRAVGMQRSGVRRMVLQESVIITLLGTLVGVVFGTALGLGLTRFMADDVATTYVIPWQAIGVVIVVAVIVGALAAFLPARKAAKLDVLDAIAED